MIDIPAPLMRRLLDLVAAGGELFNPDSLVFASRNGTGLKTQGRARGAQTCRQGGRTRATRADPARSPPLLGRVCGIRAGIGRRRDTTLWIHAHQWKYRESQRS